MAIESSADGTHATMGGIVDGVAEVDEESAVAERSKREFQGEILSTSTLSDLRPVA